MKARARILTLLILMISLAGFGNTTPDLIQNSDVVTFSDYDVGGVNVSNLNVETLETDFVLISNDAEIIGEVSYQKANQKILLTQEGTLETLLVERNKPPLIHFDKNDEINYISPLRTSHKDVLIYRRARDGINCNFTSMQSK